MADQPAPLTLAQNFVNAVLAPSNYAGHDAAILRAFNIISASLTPTPQITTRLTVTPSLCNGMAILHGGATALIFDECTTCTLALVRKEGSWQTTGVSRTLNIVYLDAVKEGEEIEVVAEIVKIGGRLAHVVATMHRVKDGVLVATCAHDKVNVDPSAGKNRVQSKL